MLLNITERLYLGLLELEEEEEEMEQEEEKMEQEEEEEENNHGDLRESLQGNQTAYELHNGQRLDIGSLDDEPSVCLFRFTISEIQRICQVFELPDIIAFRENTSKKFTLGSMLALASTLCTVFNEMVAYLYDMFHEGVSYNKRHFNRFNLRRFGEAIARKGSCFPNIVGFIGGILNTTCRPTDGKRAVYDRNDRQHGLKYQSIVTPDGITASLCGPYAGSVDDQDMLDQSDVIEKLTGDLEDGGELYRIYGNTAYREEAVLIPPFKSHADITDEEKEQNVIMSALKEVVEWEFDHVATLFAFIKFRHGQKILLSRVGQFYIIATLMKNVHVCTRGGNQTTSYFGLQAPTSEEYVEEIKNLDI